MQLWVFGYGILIGVTTIFVIRAFVGDLP